MSTRRATLRASRAYPRGTIVLYVDEDSKYRFGEVLGAAKGKLKIQTPPPLRRRNRFGVTPAMVRAVAHVDRVDVAAVLRVEAAAPSRR